MICLAHLLQILAELCTAWHNFYYAARLLSCLALNKAFSFLPPPPLPESRNRESRDVEGGGRPGEIEEEERCVVHMQENTSTGWKPDENTWFDRAFLKKKGWYENLHGDERRKKRWSSVGKRIFHTLRESQGWGRSKWRVRLYCYFSAFHVCVFSPLRYPFFTKSKAFCSKLLLTKDIKETPA